MLILIFLPAVRPQLNPSQHIPLTSRDRGLLRGAMQAGSISWCTSRPLLMPSPSGMLFPSLDGKFSSSFSESESSYLLSLDAFPGRMSAMTVHSLKICSSLILDQVLHVYYLTGFSQKPGQVDYDHSLHLTDKETGMESLSLTRFRSFCLACIINCQDYHLLGLVLLNALKYG